jgi:hypothetical protein
MTFIQSETDARYGFEAFQVASDSYRTVYCELQDNNGKREVLDGTTQGSAIHLSASGRYRSRLQNFTHMFFSALILRHEADLPNIRSRGDPLF